jgi:peptidoglycan/LPS O-acetylase OafA/YrhL
MFVWRIRPHRSTLVIVCGFAFALSLGASIWTTAHDPSSAFFLLHTRAWEMLAGGLVYFLGLRQRLSPRYGAITARLGLGMIALSILLFTEASAWPGWRAMLPVGGAMLILLANRPFILTNHSSLQWIGDRSYSIYLWHWRCRPARIFTAID